MVGVPSSTKLDPAQRLAHRVNAAADIIGVKRSTIYNLINAGKLRSVKVGGTRLIPDAALRDLLHVEGQR
jgi:excisionase family DNA binding protein